MSAGLPWKVIVDTDIGTDVDDLLAITLLLGRPDVDLRAITTTYGDTAQRARVARRVCALADRADIPVFAGQAQPLGAQPVWVAGHEGALDPGVAADAAGPATTESAVDALIRIARDEPGVELLAIGPLTNIALALTRDPGFGSSVGHLWIMGGNFGAALLDPETGRAGEHNWAADAEAAAIVLGAGVPATICPLDVTMRTRLGGRATDALAGAGPLGALVHQELRRWWAYTRRPDGDPPHDALTALARLEPGLFTCAPVRVGVETDPAHAGVVTATAWPGSPVSVVTDVDVPRAERHVLDGVLAGCRRSAPAGRGV